MSHSPGLVSGVILPAWTLCAREIVRFYRQRSRVIGALLPPIIFWFLIGSGLGGSFRVGGDGLATDFAASGGKNYLQFFFPGTIVMIVLFTSVFSTISIIEDRKEGFLQSVLVAPVSRFSIVLGKVSGGAILAFLQGLAFVFLAPTMDITFRPGSILFVLSILFLVSFGLTALGFIIAWRMDSTQGYHSIMNLFLMPMWFLSGALFPIETVPGWLKWLMVINPLTYSVAALRNGFYQDTLSHSASFPTPAVCLAVTVLFCAVTFSLSVVICSKREWGS